MRTLVVRIALSITLLATACTTPPVEAVDAAEPLDASTLDAATHDAGVDASADSATADATDAASSDGSSDAGAVDAPFACLVTAPSVCPDPELEYADVEPIILSRCTVCHDGSGTEWALDTYFHVVDWGPDIRTRLLECSMPPPDSGMTIPTAESQLILDWIRCGMPRTAP